MTGHNWKEHGDALGDRYTIRRDLCAICGAERERERRKSKKGGQRWFVRGYRRKAGEGDFARTPIPCTGAPQPDPVPTLFVGLDRRAVADALMLVADLDSWRDLSHTARVSVGRVMSYCWHPGRLDRCLRQAEEGTAPPRIHCVRVNIGRGRGREAYYIPSDGNHRTEAARTLGREYIAATVSGEYEARPEYFALDAPARKLWRTVGRGVYTLVRADLSDEVIAVLRTLRVPART